MIRQEDERHFREIFPHADDRYIASLVEEMAGRRSAYFARAAAVQEDRDRVSAADLTGEGLSPLARISQLDAIATRLTGGDIVVVDQPRKGRSWLYNRVIDLNYSATLYLGVPAVRDGQDFKPGRFFAAAHMEQEIPNAGQFRVWFRDTTEAESLPSDVFQKGLREGTWDPPVFGTNNDGVTFVNFNLPFPPFGNRHIGYRSGDLEPLREERRVLTEALVDWTVGSVREGKILPVPEVVFQAFQQRFPAEPAKE